jgi:hypothetical protein
MSAPREPGHQLVGSRVTVRDRDCLVSRRDGDRDLLYISSCLNHSAKAIQRPKSPLRVQHRFFLTVGSCPHQPVERTQGARMQRKEGGRQREYPAKSDGEAILLIHTPR